MHGYQKRSCSEEEVWMMGAWEADKSDTEDLERSTGRKWMEPTRSMRENDRL